MALLKVPAGWFLVGMAPSVLVSLTVMWVERQGDAILEVLSDRRERSGLELVEAWPERIKRGSVYVACNRLEQSGDITSRKVAGRYYYRITPSGNSRERQRREKQEERQWWQPGLDGATVGK